MKILFCLACVLVCFVSGFAQERVIDKSEFEVILKNENHPFMRWSGKKSFRRTVTLDSHQEGITNAPESTKWSRKNSMNSVDEWQVDPKAYRHFSGVSFDDKPYPTQETIKIDDVTYARIGGGPWSKKESESGKKTPPPPPSAIPNRYEKLTSEITYKYLGTEVFKNATVRTYLKTEKNSSINKETGKTAEDVSTTKYWVAEDGTFLKSDFKAEHKDGTSTATTMVIEEFEIDPTITIAAPIVSSPVVKQ